MNKHTPGPWKIGRGYYITAQDGRVLAAVQVNDADVRLIAAAPELLAACETAYLYILGQHGNPGRSETLGRLYNAITKTRLEGDECPPTPRTDRR